MSSRATTTPPKAGDEPRVHDLSTIRHLFEDLQNSADDTPPIEMITRVGEVYEMLEVLVEETVAFREEVNRYWWKNTRQVVRELKELEKITGGQNE